MTKRMGDIYVGEENEPIYKRHLRIAPGLTVDKAHAHLCGTCNRNYYCWCWKPARGEGQCMSCLHEAHLPKVVHNRKGSDGNAHSKIFSNIEVSQGGWAYRWVTTRELRAALNRWVSQEYKASPPEVTVAAGAYQCGGCRFFLALDSDYGICGNAASRYDGRIVFEHIGCEANPWYIKNHQRGDKGRS